MTRDLSASFYRGLVFGLAICLPMWAVIIAVLWWAL